MSKKRIRQIITLIVILIVIAALVFAFQPKPILVDMGTVENGHMMLTINEEGRTRVRDEYIISAPISGNLLRVELEPGDSVKQGETVVARMLPSAPPALDARQTQQARAAVKAAQAAVTASNAQLERIKADYNLAVSSLQRSEKLFADGAISKARIDEARSREEAAKAGIENAKAEISLREAELENAKATLIGLENTGTQRENIIEIKSPINGQVLLVSQKSSATIAAGTPILSLGNVEEDLEIVVELLSTEAVRVNPDDRVIIDNWGGDFPLNGYVSTIEPGAFTKFSALGVEEQRVNTIIHLDPTDNTAVNLGHGYRVEARIVVWEDDNALIVPSSALVRQQEDWAVFVVNENTASLRTVKISQNNGRQANCVEGLKAGEKVILYPAEEITDGVEVEAR